MALQKQDVNINFAQGLDTKTDPFQVQPGQFLALKNSVFQKGGLLQKRNGFGKSSVLPRTDYNYLTTFKDDLIAVGAKISSYSIGNREWVEKGDFKNVKLATKSLVKNSSSQTIADIARSDNGLICTVYQQSNHPNNQNPGGSAGTLVISDAITSQVVFGPSQFDGNNQVIGGARVFFIGKFFFILFIIQDPNSPGVYKLVWVAIDSHTFESPNLIDTGGAFDLVPFDLVPSGGANVQANTQSCFDAVPVQNYLYISWLGIGTSGVKAVTMSAQLVIGAVRLIDASVGFKTFSLCSIEATGGLYYIWIVYSNGQIIRACLIDQGVNIQAGYPVQILNQNQPTTPIISLTSSAHKVGNDLTLTTLYDVFSTLGYDTSKRNDSIHSFEWSNNTKSILLQSFLVDGLGLSSKTFEIDGDIYFLANFQSVNQSSYFLMKYNKFIPKDSVDQTPVANALPISRLAYGNAYFQGTFTSTGNVATGSTVIQNVIGFNGVAVGKLITSPTAGLIPAGTTIVDFRTSGTIFSSITMSANATGTLVGATLVISDRLDNILLPNVYTDGNKGYTPYIRRNVLIPVNKQTGTSVVQTPDVFAQYGVNLAEFTIGGNDIISAEIGSNLHMSGGFVWAYDGKSAAEQNFFIYPHDIKVTYSSTDGRMGPTPNGDTTNSGGVYYAYIVVYEWTDNQGNTFRSSPSVPVFVKTVTGTGKTGTGKAEIFYPTLRLSYKDLFQVKISIYRWSAGQQTYYEVTSIIQPNLNFPIFSNSSFVDRQNDSEIIGNNILYTNGGVLEDVAPPATSIMALFDNRLWLVDAEDPNVLWFSKQVIEGTPVEMSDLQTFFVSPTAAAQGPTGPITALAAMDDKLVIFKKNAIYYINGTGPDITGTNSQYSEPTFVTSTIGCTNEKSIVFMPNGLMFQSDKGIWLLGRDLSTNYLGAPVELFNDAIVVSSNNIPGTNQVRFTMSNGLTLMYDYYFNQWGTFEGVPSLSSTLFEGKHTLLRSPHISIPDNTLSVLQETQGAYLDDTSPVTMSFTTGWFNLAGLQGYERAYYFYFLASFLTPHKMWIDLSYDYYPSPSQTLVINPGITYDVYGSGSPYGQEIVFGGDSNIEQWRVFFQNQKCQSFQIRLTEYYDYKQNVTPGAGFTMSGINLVVGAKKGYSRVAPSKSTG